jgi:photosystem II stability/assembly factor-like uncharacterized protein
MRDEVRERRGSGRVRVSLLPRLARWAGVGVFVFGIAVLVSCEDDEDDVYYAPWRIIQGPVDSDIFDLFFLSPDDGWALTYEKVLHYDGSSWEVVKEFDERGNEYYLGALDMWFFTANEGWLVGTEVTDIYEPYPESHSKIWRYEGGTWREFPHEDLGGLVGLWFNSPDDGWVCGEGGFLHWNGSAWERVIPEIRYSFSDTCFLSKDDGWAVGFWGGMQHWDGATWTDVPFDIQAKINEVNCIAFNEADSGWVGYGGYYRWNMYHYDGKEWELYKTKLTALDFKNIHFLGANNGWAVGSNTPPYRPPNAGWRWDGEGWRPYPFPPVFSPRSVWTVSESEVWAGGKKGRFAYLKY